METIKPKKLKKGDTIGIISLSGAVKNPQLVYNCQDFLHSQGYNTKLSKNIFDKKRYLAGEDETKLECLKEFFEDSEIDAILVARGGFGAIRILNDINYDIIKSNPKIFAGYSDVTAYSTMILKKAGLITFSAPMACSDFGQAEVNELTSNSFFNTLSSVDPLILQPERPTVYHEGGASGILLGGNLSTICSLCGTDFIPNEPFIFFAEDLNEDVYRIDKMFSQLLNLPQFRTNLQGIILGEFLDISSEDDLHELFCELGKRLNVPILDGFKITHAKEKITVPIGANASFNTDDKRVNIEPCLIN